MNIIEVEWLDAAQEKGVIPIEKATELKPMPRKNVGYLLEESEEKLVVAFGWISDTNVEAETYEDTLVIPKSMVINRRELE